MGVYHAKLGPSSASRWTSCTASPAAQENRPSESSAASRTGTAGHQIGAECLEHGHDPASYVGRVLCFLNDRREVWEEHVDDGMVVEYRERVTFELTEAATKYVGFVRNLRDTLGGELIVEQPVPIDHITGEDGATGMADAILIAGDTLVTVDAKFGRAKVHAYDVLEEESYDLVTGEILPPKLRINLQLGMYLLGSLEKYSILADFRYVKGIIVQPTLNHVSEYQCSVEELLELKAWLTERAEATRASPEFVPSGKNCHFCRARFDCYARNRVVLETALEGFDDIVAAIPAKVTIPRLGDLYEKLDMIRDWCNDVEVKVMDELMKGRTVKRADGVKYKLVEGRKGNKEWKDPEAVEKMMLDMNLKPDVIYNRKLISPTQAEKLAKSEEKTIGRNKWLRLQEQISRKHGKPEPAPKTDPRPEYDFLEYGFDDI